MTETADSAPIFQGYPHEAISYENDRMGCDGRGRGNAETPIAALPWVPLLISDAPILAEFQRHYQSAKSNLNRAAAARSISAVFQALPLCDSPPRPCPNTGQLTI
jgi:hypothetical protein